MRRIKQMSVTGLFGIFDHTIPLNMEERITIIHGPNGFGKTVLLSILNALFNVAHQYLFKVPFRKFQVDFDDGCYVLLEQAEEGANGLNKLLVQVRGPGLAEYTFPLSEWDGDEIIEFIEHIPTLRRIDQQVWLERSSGELLSVDGIVERYSDSLPPTINRMPEQWRELLKTVNIRFIQTERLLSPTRRPAARYAPSGKLYDASSMSSSVEIYARELARTIESKLAAYASQSQLLDRTFPRRLLEQNSSPKLSDDELREKLAELEDKRQRFIAAGLLDQSEEMSAIPDQIREGAIEDDTRGVLSVYVDDVAQKLGVLEDIARKIDLLRTIINKRFHYNKMTVSKKEGFSFTASNGNPLSPTALSSGEQHELVMMYEFLFKLKPGTLILIDEPEISLHVAWQIEFLNDLQQIIALSDFDVLMATHSPDIINNRWDLTVDLAATAETSTV